MNPELKAILELLSMLLVDPRTGVLIAALVLASWSDVRTGRIPNELVYSGMAVGLAYNTLSPVQGGGLLWSLQGLGTGLALLLPFYAIRIMGAGDVKLMAMAGAFLGFRDTLWALLASLLAGGVLSMAFVIRDGAFRRLFANLALMAQGAAIGNPLRATTADSRVSVGTLPYGVAIAAGTIGYLVLRQLGFVG